MKTSAVELIRCCPFCGSHEVEVCRTNDNACWIRCSVCGAESQSHAIRQRAVELWNRRYHDDVPSKITQDDDAADVASKVKLATDALRTLAAVDVLVAAAQDALI